MTRKRWHRCTNKITVATPALAQAWRRLAIAAVAIGRADSSDWEALRRAYGRVAMSGPIGLDIPLNSCLRLRKAVANAIFPRERHWWTPAMFIELGEQVIIDCDLVIAAGDLKRAEAVKGEARS